MDGKIATIAGAAALVVAPAIAGATPAAASQPAVPVAATYADLLSPIPNAVERLKIADMQAQTETAQPQLIQAQYYDHHHHHHHNHYRRYSRRAWYLAHGYYWYGGQWVLRPRYHHHHHHHHHHNNY
ncbi:MAG TPA: hypothetical protein VGF50_08235 [Caulobacteraceae bacterium]